MVSESARTRSQKKITPDQWTTVPLLAKIFKLLVGEVSNHLDAALASKYFLVILDLLKIETIKVHLGATDDDYEDDDSEDWVEDDVESNGHNNERSLNGTDLSKLLSNGGGKSAR